MIILQIIFYINLLQNGKVISWKHLEDLYIQDSREASKGTRLVLEDLVEIVWILNFQ